MVGPIFFGIYANFVPLKLAHGSRVLKCPTLVTPLKCGPSKKAVVTLNVALKHDR